jgi:3-oxoacyl-[acyl-carrier protein] reductase
MTKRLSDRIALITGGAQGLGESIALAMANEGADIVICDINTKTLPGAKSEIEIAGARCLAVQCDVSSVDSVANLFRELVSTFGRLDILVNNAALVQTGARSKAMRAKFYKMITTRIRGGLRIMEPKKSGKIVNIASILGQGDLAPSILRTAQRQIELGERRNPRFRQDPHH